MTCSSGFGSCRVADSLSYVGHQTIETHTVKMKNETQQGSHAECHNLVTPVAMH